MKNLIKKAYGSFDAALMYGVNKGVHAWNWTTGRTKGDLANLFSILGCATMTAGNFIPLGLISPLISLPWAYFGYRDYFQNKNIERLEKRALDKGLLDLEVEGFKLKSAFVGPVFLGISGFASAHKAIMDYRTEDSKKTESDHETSSFSSMLINIGISLYGLQFYVMRADYLPPRKNVLQRTADKLADIVRNYRLKPGTVPLNLNNLDY